MNCREVQLHLSAWVDESLEAELEGSVRDHLARCTPCSRFSREIQGLNRLLQTEKPELDPPERIWRRIEANLAPEVSRPAVNQPVAFDLRDWLRLPVLRFALPTLLLLIGLSVYFLYDSGRSEGEGTARMLAELESFQLEVEGNPFLRTVSAHNPFFRVEVDTDRNPFESGSQEP